MAEKPRIKDTDEIMDSIVTGRARRRPVAPEEDSSPSSTLQQEQDEAPKKRRGRPRKNDLPAERPAEPEGFVPDPSPLDFDKYKLPEKPPKRRGRPRKESVQLPAEEDSAEQSPLPQAPPEPVAESVPDTPNEPQEPGKPVVSAEEVQVKEFDFVDLEEQEKQKKQEAQAKEREEALRNRRRQDRTQLHAQAEAERLRKQAELEAQRARKQAAEEAELAIRKAEEEAARIQQAAEEEAERLRLQAEEEAQRIQIERESRRKLIEDDQYREDVLDQLGNQFEEQFSQAFESKKKAKPEEERPWWLEERREGLGKPVRASSPPQAPEAPTDGQASEESPPAERQLPAQDPPARDRQRQASSESGAAAQTEPEPLPPSHGQEAPPYAVMSLEQERQAERETERFMQLFAEREAQREKEEDSQVETDFRETLAEKFMRERERYLEDLGISDQMEAERAAQKEAERLRAETENTLKPPTRRKLDFQIRPEMHMAEGEIPVSPPVAPPRAPAPVMYNQAAEPMPQEDVEQALPYLPVADTPTDADQPQERKGDGGKSAEQLLLELGELNKQRGTRRPKQAQSHFRFQTVGEELEKGKGKKKGLLGSFRSPAILLSACAGLLVLTLIVWGVSYALRPQDAIQEDGMQDPAIVDDTGDVKSLYESFNPESMMRFQDVEIKRSGLTVSNVTALNRLIVSETVTAEGSLSLSNVIVGELIYIRNSGINHLDLEDVQAERLVIYNEQHDVTIVASGSTDIVSMEVRSPVHIEQTDMLPEAPGIRSITVLAEDSEEPMQIAVKNTRMASLFTEGETTASFEESTIETLSADGSFSLTGTGRVNEMNFGYNAGGGAQTAPMSLPVQLLVTGVDLGRLNVKSAATVNINSPVDSVYVSNPVNLGGSGTVGHLVFNQASNNARVPADISGLNIQQLTTNGETLFYSSGSSVINTLIANKSTWALGNKVNLLNANANGIIYENEPDAKRIAQGIEPPQSKAENPNLNYDLNYDFSLDTGASASGVSDGDALDSDVATTCDHSRESGGFIMGEGSKVDPFLVETAAQLAHVSQHPSSHYLQTTDIDLARDSAYADGFPMIGSSGTRFSGTYNGGGHSIQNLRILGTGENVGLFSQNSGTISDLRIASGEVRAAENSFTGALVGMNLQDGVVKNCSNGATLAGTNSLYTGGVVGYNYGGRVLDCYNTGKVEGGDAAGGIVGRNLQKASVTGCYNIGVVDGSGSFGAVAGINEAVVANCYYLYSEGLSGIGQGDGNAVAKTSGQLSSAQAAADLAAGSETSQWHFVGGDYAYPTLKRPGIDSVPAASTSVLPETPAEESQEELEAYDPTSLSKAADDAEWGGGEEQEDGFE